MAHNPPQIKVAMCGRTKAQRNTVSTTRTKQTKIDFLFAIQFLHLHNDVYTV